MSSNEIGNDGLRMLFEGGRPYVALPLRDAMGFLDLSDFPAIGECRRLGEENDALRELIGYARDYISGGEAGCRRCPIADACESLPRCTFPQWFEGRVSEV